MKAWLVTNEFLHSNKFTEIHSWFIEAAKKKGIDLQIKTNAEILAVLGSGYRQKPPLDFILFWDKDVRLANYLECMGYLVMNSSQAIAACDDKSMTHLILQSQGIPMPKTVLGPMTYENIGYTNYDFLEIVQRELEYPIIVKECFGSFGAQVYKAETAEQLKALVQQIGNKPMLFQEYIASSKGKDLRLHVVGDQVVTAMYRYSVNGDFRANISNGGHMKPYEPTELEKELAIESIKALGLDFAGVDLLFGEDGTALVCEVNSNAHFRNIYDCTGVNVADSIMDYILKKCN